MVPSGRVIVTGLAAVVLEGGSSRLLRAVRRLIGTVALQAVIAACRWRRHGLDFTAWLTSEATQDPGKVEICPVRTTDALAPVSGSRQLACGVARAPGDQLGHFATLPGSCRDTARQLLAMLTIGCRTLDRFEDERAYLFGIGIPAGFLPSARELGRSDLT